MLGYVLQHPGRAIRAIASDPLALWETLSGKAHAGARIRPPAARIFRRRRMGAASARAAGRAAARVDAAADFQAALEARGRARSRPWASTSGPTVSTATTTATARWCARCGAWSIICGPPMWSRPGWRAALPRASFWKALRTNNDGELFSIDLPPLDPAMKAQVGMAVGENFARALDPARRHQPAPPAAAAQAAGRHRPVRARQPAHRKERALRAGSRLGVSQARRRHGGRRRRFQLGLRILPQGVPGHTAVGLRRRAGAARRAPLQQAGQFAIMLKNR